MKFLLRFYFSLVLLFVLAKPVFMLCNGASGIGVVTKDYFEVMLHGLPLDLTTAGYLTALPWLACLIGIFVPARSPWRKVAQRAYMAYAALLAVALSLIFVADTCLYAYWDFKLDTTVLAYIDSPRGMASSVTPLYMATVVVCFISLAALILGWLWLVRPTLPKGHVPTLRSSTRAARTAVMVVAGGALFLAIRGGVKQSTANVGMVYYSPRQFMNHSAVNPAFSFFYSYVKSQSRSKNTRYFDEDTCTQIFSQMAYNTESLIAPADSLLTCRRPNVLIILMEGCGGTLVEAAGGAKGITPHLNALAQEGVLFSQCYANSFRTDRGTVCALSGYPSFPDVSVMKLPAKSSTLPSIAASLKKAGYRTEFLYGGDKNFTNMNSYLLSTGYDRVYGDTDFPAEVRRTHAWGVTDRIVFGRLAELIGSYPANQPWHVTLLTLASHEPWEVPYDKLKRRGAVANAFAYLDDCIGAFIEKFRKTPQWQNTLIVLLPDHGITWPNGIPESDVEKYHIPLIWTGGAVKAARNVGCICNQTDLAATLLGQLGLPHADFAFSRDVMSQTYTYPCAHHTWSEGLSFIDSTGATVIDMATSRALTDSPTPSETRAKRAKAFLQTAYKDLESR